MGVSSVLLLCSFSENLQFYCCLALFCFIFIILVSQYLRRIYLQKFTQRYNTTSETTKKRVDIAFVILFTLLSYNIS